MRSSPEIDRLNHEYRTNRSEIDGSRARSFGSVRYLDGLFGAREIVIFTDELPTKLLED